MKKNIGKNLALYPTVLVVVGTMVDGKPNWTLVGHLGIIGHDHVLVSMAVPHYSNRGIRENKCSLGNSLCCRCAETIQITIQASIPPGRRWMLPERMRLVSSCISSQISKGLRGCGWQSGRNPPPAVETLRNLRRAPVGAAASIDGQDPACRFPLADAVVHGEFFDIVVSLLL